MISVTNLDSHCGAVTSQPFLCWPAVTAACAVNTLRPKPNGRSFAHDSFKWIFLNENIWISLKISLKFVPKGPINIILALVWIMAWRRPGDKPLSEPMMVSLPTHICVTRPQWVKGTKFTKHLFSLYQGFHVFFYPRPLLASGNCRCMCLCVCVYQSLACPHDNSSPAQARITKFGAEKQNTLVKIPIVEGGGGQLTLTIKVKFNFKLKIDAILSLSKPLLTNFSC